MTVTFETLSAIYRIAKYFIYADGDMTDEEVKPLFDFFQTFPDIDKEKLDFIMKSGDEMADSRAVELISGLDADGKQQMSNLFAKIICTDGQLTDDEKRLFFRVRDLCDLPDPESEDSEDEEESGQAPAPAAAPAAEEDDTIMPAFIVVTYQGFCTFEQSPNRDWGTLGGELADWIGADGVEVVRYTPALNALSEKLRLNQRHLVFMVARNGYGDKTVGDNMPATILYGRGYPLYGNIVFALETDQGYEIEGIITKKLLVETATAINEAVDGLLRMKE